MQDHAKKARIPLRFAASKLAENDSLLLEQLDLSQNEKEILEHIRKQLKKKVVLIVQLLLPVIVFIQSLIFVDKL